MGTVDMTGWSEVTDGNGKVVGWVAPGDVDTPLEAAHRRAVAGVRADVTEAAATVLMDEAFDVESVCESARRQVGHAATQAALGVAYELLQIEQLRM
jgi:hypothetical protein